MDTLALREKVISTKDFSAHYFNTLSSFFSQQILLQARAHFPNQRALKVESYNSRFVLETEGDSKWFTFMSYGVHEAVALQLL